MLFYIKTAGAVWHCFYIYILRYCRTTVFILNDNRGKVNILVEIIRLLGGDPHPPHGFHLLLKRPLALPFFEDLLQPLIALDHTLYVAV